jgi:peptidoglycan hydrolase-like protein with peptidoglycan-binding domain
MTDANRIEVQRGLARLRYYAGPIDGIFGPLTRAAIRHYQGSIGGTATGTLTYQEATRLLKRGTD